MIDDIWFSLKDLVVPLGHVVFFRSRPGPDWTADKLTDLPPVIGPESANCDWLVWKPIHSRLVFVVSSICR